MEGGQDLATGFKKKKKKGIFSFLQYDRTSLKSRLRKKHKKTLPEVTSPVVNMLSVWRGLKGWRRKGLKTKDKDLSWDQ